MRLDLTCPALSASLHTTDPAVASRWLISVLYTCPIGAQVAILVNGVNRGSRVHARLMSVSEDTLERAIRAEAKIVESTPKQLFPIAA